MANHKSQQQVDVAAIAARRHLGVPLKRHTHNLGIAAGIGCGILVLAFYALLLIALVQFVFQRENNVIGWLSLTIGLLAMLRFASFLFDQVRAYRHRSAYECSDGFFVMDGRGQAAQVTMALRWDEVASVWKGWEKLGRSRQFRRYVHDQHGRLYILTEYPRIWRRCQKELALRGISSEPVQK
jgi:hypothetical protein